MPGGGKQPGAGRPPGPTRLDQTITFKDADGSDQRATVRDRIWERIETLGLTPATAGKVAGVSAVTIWGWVKDGRQAIDREQRGLPLFAHERRLRDFVNGCDVAHARYVDRQNEIIESFAKGGLVISEVTEEVDPTQQGPDGRPMVLSRKVKRRILLPDPKMAIWNLERKAKDEHTPRVELTGADGAPLIPASGEVESFLDELRAYEAGKYDAAAAAELAAGTVADVD